MTRYVLVRRDDGSEMPVPETPLPAEARLHDALTDHPELLPTEDFGFGRTVVIGREAVLASGYADLVLIDERGQLCLVEVKKQGNPDTRLVVAQLLDYAGAIWGQSLDEFDRSVLAPFIKKTRGREGVISLREFLSASFKDAGELATVDGDDALPDDTLSSLEAGLSSTLETGRFILVVAAPEIPLSVRRALEYLNAQGMRLFAVEYSYFAEEVEVIVPRIVVSPLPEQQQSRLRSRAEPIDRETFIAKLQPHAGAFIANVLDACMERGAEVVWNATGPSIRVLADEGRPSVAIFEERRVYLVLKPPASVNPRPFDVFRNHLRKISVGAETESGGFRRIDFATVDGERLDELLAPMVTLCETLADENSLDRQELAPPTVVHFQRNDYNIWETVAPELVPYRGRRLWGTLRRDEGLSAAVILKPLARGTRGWVPRFLDATGGSAVWPAGEYAGSFTLEISHAEVLVTRQA